VEVKGLGFRGTPGKTDASGDRMRCCFGEGSSGDVRGRLRGVFEGVGKQGFDGPVRGYGRVTVECLEVVATWRSDKCIGVDGERGL
jgi:hypothetical protein